MNRYRNFRILFPVFLLILSFASISLYAFEPPIDFLSYTYSDIEEDPATELVDGRLEKQGNFEYFNNRITYDISFNKRDPEDGYVFFNRTSNNTDIIVEFYRDFLMYYAMKSTLMWAHYVEDLDTSQMNHYFAFPGRKVLLVYRKNSARSGMYGFGIRFGSWGYTEETEQEMISSYLVEGSVEKMSNFDPGEESSYKNKIFITDEAVVTAAEILGSNIDNIFQYNFDGKISWRSQTVYIEPEINKIFFEVNTEDTKAIADIFVRINDELYPLKDFLDPHENSISAYEIKGICLVRFSEEPSDTQFSLTVSSRNLQ
ncbi:hypothetical protein B4O97_04130 [Marispirochaeta aestuarii]|uniref:Uncharacterized protein n=1 Tax=Marispirochaeta aestuarii TaxID=1963862 RepID=A0A1Y1S1R8_9SPIO|nr:hypothetical protein [Marispirochaeta aestuarii]ORC37387.1 hypothetical protein B4O97_04130 [Marispirochaeta aestuarii]